MVLSTILSNNAFLNAFVAPSAFFDQFDDLKKHGPWVVFGLMCTIILSHFWFFQGMSEEWLLSQQLAQVTDLTPQELAITEDMMRKSLPYMGTFVGVITALSLLAQVVILGGYFFSVQRIMPLKQLHYSFKYWFSFVGWCYLPWIVNYLVFTFLFLSSSTTDLPLNLINYASLDQLLIGSSVTNPLHAFGNSMNLFYLWTLAMLSLGLKKIFKVPLAHSMMISVFPFAVVFGAWFIAT